TTVIAVGVVGGMAFGQRPDPPTAEHVRLTQPVGYSSDEGLFDDAGCQAMPGVRTDRANLPLVGIKRHRKKSTILHPERFVEPFLECEGRLMEPTCFILFVQPPEEL